MHMPEIKNTNQKFILALVIVLLLGRLLVVETRDITHSQEMDAIEIKIERLQAQADKTHEQCIQELYRGTPNLRGN